VTLDDEEITVPAGTLIIRAAEQLGIEVPRFCDHPFLAPVGACRQCYVEVEGQRKLFTSCTTEVAPGMAVRTQNTSDEAHRAQVANLEFLLLNHPLDCPICDQGGECPLQTRSRSTGRARTRGEAVYEAARPLMSEPRPRTLCALRAVYGQLRPDLRRSFHQLFARGAASRSRSRLG
jgi:NADH-quinone oxidoreductase subunit G